MHVAFFARTSTFLMEVKTMLLLMSVEKGTRLLHSHLAVQSLLCPFQPVCTPADDSVEAQWALFVAKRNLALLTSGHTSRMFSKMFPDSKTVSNFGCGRTKTTSIVKEILAPHYHEKIIQFISNPQIE